MNQAKSPKAEAPAYFEGCFPTRAVIFFDREQAMLCAAAFEDWLSQCRVYTINRLRCSPRGRTASRRRRNCSSKYRSLTGRTEWIFKRRQTPRFARFRLNAGEIRG